MESEYRISVIIPVYNGEKYIAEAISSVLNQSYKPFEVIIIDDGSDDKTADIVAGFLGSLRYIYQENAGIAAARNLGVAKSEGEYIAFLDADDYWVADKLSLQTAALAKDNSLEAAFGMVQQFYSPETDETFRQSVVCPTEPSKGPHPGTLLIRKDTFLRVGYFSTNFKTGEFIDWYARAGEKGLRIVSVPEVLMYRRIHHTNYGLTHKAEKEDYAKIVRDMLLRRKGRKQNDD